MPSEAPRKLNENLDEDMPSNRVILAFGGLARFCELTGFGMSTVYAWQKSGLVPAKWRYDNDLSRSESYGRYIMRIAGENGIELEATIFFEDAA